MSFGKGYARYKEIGRQNDRALDCLGQMLQPEQGAEGIERLFLQAVQATKAMIRSYCRTSGEETAGYARALAGAAQQGSRAVHYAALCKGITAEECRQQLNKSVCGLTNEKGTIRECATLHDIVRHVHQKAKEWLFSIKAIEGVRFDSLTSRNKARLCIGGDEFLIIDMGGALERQEMKEEYDEEGEEIGIKDIRCEPLRQIVQFYNSKRAGRKPGDEHYSCLATKEALAAQIHLGAHYSEIAAVFDDEKRQYAIEFRYRDTEHEKSSRQRTEIMRQIAERLGFKARQNNGRNVIKGKYQTTHPEEAKKTIKEIARAFASVRNVDVMDVPERDIGYAVSRFFKGKVHLEACLLEARGKR